MTITNHPSDGLPPELIVLYRLLASHEPMDKETVIRLCGGEDAARIRMTLSTWSHLGLFCQRDEDLSIDSRFARKRRESLDELTVRLPEICRRLAFVEHNGLPLWNPTGEREDKNIGASGDFVRELSWLLAQDIYTFPRHVTEELAVRLEQAQIGHPKFIFVNKVRWTGLRYWARYMGFATGNEGAFCIDPTEAIRAELPSMFAEIQTLSARQFVDALGSRLPVLDSGRYRIEVENALDPQTWRKPPPGQLSMSLSFALQRLKQQNVIELASRADAPETLTLSGRDYQPWGRFTDLTLPKTAP